MTRAGRVRRRPDPMPSHVQTGLKGKRMDQQAPVSANAAPVGPYQLPLLKSADDALEPIMDERCGFITTSTIKATLTM